MKKMLALFLALGLLPALSWGAIVVSVEPTPIEVQVGQPFTVDIVADIDEDIIGFDLTLTFDAALLTLNETLFGADFFPGGLPDDPSDGIVALVALAFPAPVSGPDVLLATLDFTASLTTGTTSLRLEESTPGAGFPLDSEDAETTVAFTPGLVTVEAPVAIPEPTTGILIGTGLLGVLGMASYRQRRS